ncbi:MOXD1 -like 1 [Asbolus verrucosus]|uniref:MOXD1-like 1 n=1 Tax=Asbolus verrucosus TaxID=1661398 RepID=A0A482W200_ASBVE|nr:MOXD1 -like 1 [Asbolus verrucosus]
MAPIIWHLAVISLVALVNAADVPDDLLDEYVRHIDDVNRISEKPNRLDQRPRKRRDVPSQWTHSEVLDRVGDVVLRWQPRHQEILFRVEARTKGYVAIGFSPDGGKENADIVLGWVDDNTLRAFLLDCHGVPESQGSVPIKDETDNYTLMSGSQNDTHTVIEFRRVLDTCDRNDYVLTGDTVVVIWAYHDADPRLGAEMIYHGDKRGAQSLHLLGPPPVPKARGSNIRQWDVTLKNFEIINNMNTIYWCKVFKAPTLRQKHHIVGYEPLIGANHSSFVHHMILHECELDARDDLSKWDRFSKENGRLCYGPNMVQEWEKCLPPLVAWAIGSKGENFPRHVGLPLANKKNSYYMLEVHFDNPSMKQAQDTSGLRLFYTSDLRENEGGILTTGIALSSLHFIPPFQKEYKTAGYCSTDCTKETFPKEGIHVVSVMLHSHLAGRKLKLRHIRAGKELPPLAQDDHYDFNYQQSRALSQDTIILPGDGLVTECTYSTLTRNKPTLGGYSTKEEMCLAFILHYPRTELSNCNSMSPIKYFFENLGVKEFYGKTMTDIENMFLHGETEPNPVSPATPIKPLFAYKPGDEMSPEANRRAIIALQNAKDYTIEGDTYEGQTMFDKLVIKEPEEFRNKTFMDHLQDIPYNETLLTKKMEEYFYTGLHLTFCRKRDDSLAIKESVIQFPNFTTYSDRENQIQCSSKLKRSPSSSASMKSSFITTIILSVSTLTLIVCEQPHVNYERTAGVGT